MRQTHKTLFNLNRISISFIQTKFWNESFTAFYQITQKVEKTFWTQVKSERWKVKTYANKSFIFHLCSAGKLKSFNRETFIKGEILSIEWNKNKLLACNIKFKPDG